MEILILDVGAFFFDLEEVLFLGFELPVLPSVARIRIEGIGCDSSDGCPSSFRTGGEVSAAAGSCFWTR